VFFWNCWVRNRYRLLAYLAAGCALVLLGTLPVTTAWIHGHLVWVHPRTLTDARAVWNIGVEHVALVMIFLLLVAGADLGSLGVGESAAQKEYDFLLTRPRRRRHFVWTAYGAGLAQLGLMTLVPLAVAMMALYALTSRFCPNLLWPLTVGALVACCLVFSAAFALSVATGSSRTGFELAFCLIFAYYVSWEVMWRVGIWLIAFYGYRPRYGRLFYGNYAGHAYDWLLNGDQVNYLYLLVMLGVSAGLAFVAQIGFERKDV
jgi:ABC-type transport system involved in multi-copper enzyme maturation permease subunit